MKTPLYLSNLKPNRSQYPKLLYKKALERHNLPLNTPYPQPIIDFLPKHISLHQLVIKAKLKRKGVHIKQNTKEKKEKVKASSIWKTQPLGERKDTNKKKYNPPL